MKLPRYEGLLSPRYQIRRAAITPDDQTRNEIQYVTQRATKDCPQQSSSASENEVNMGKQDEPPIKKVKMDQETLN